jgi:hypothetical protein
MRHRLRGTLVRLPRRAGQRGILGKAGPVTRALGSVRPGVTQKGLYSSFYVATVVKPPAYFFAPAFFGHWITSPRPVWRLPVALGPIRLQRPSIRVGSHAHHPILFTSFDESWMAWVRQPHLFHGFSGPHGLYGPPPPAPKSSSDSVPPHGLRLFQDGPPWDNSALEKSPQRTEQRPRHCDTPDAPQALAPAPKALSRPVTQHTFRLVTQPTPGQLRGHPAPVLVARLGEALCSDTRATVIRRWGSAR